MRVFNFKPQTRRFNAGSFAYQLIMEYPSIPRVLGLFVTEINKSGPAYECGIMPSDVIVQIGEERVTSDIHARALFSAIICHSIF